MAQAARKAPLDIRHWDVVPAVGDPFGHAQFGHFDTRQGQIDQLHPPAVGAQPLDQAQIGSSRQGGFKSEVLAGGDTLLDLPQKKTAGGQQLPLRGERREPGGDQVGVDEMSAARYLGQILQGESGFARAVGSGDDPAGGVGFVVPLLEL